MLSLPVEILLEIFEAACIHDDGSTGRSLSSVSRYFLEVSRPVKLTSVAVRGEAQLVGFAEMLKRTPSRFRRVEHLFVKGPQRASGKRRKSAVLIDAKMKHSEDFWVYEQTASSALLQILTLVGPTLKTLFITSDVAIPRTSLLVPVSLPHVSSITLQGKIAGWRRRRSLSFPSLRSLSILSFTEAPVNVLQELAQCAPHVKELTLAPERPSLHLAFNMFASIAIAGDLESMLMSTERVRVWLSKSWEENMWTKATRQSMLTMLDKLAETDKRIEVVHITGVPSCKEVEAFWLTGDSSAVITDIHGRQY